MELVKREDHWALYNEDGHKIAATIPGCNSKLSIKNCEAIENGYDLNELGMDYALTIYDGRTESIRFNGAKVDFIKGFQKALELMKHRLVEETEWQVEVLMDICGDKVYAVPEPVLDEQGCLILKRIDN